MLGDLIKAISAGLSIWDSKEKTKYVDQLFKAKEDYYAELSKPLAERSDDELARIKQRVRLINEAFCAAVTAKGA